MALPVQPKPAAPSIGERQQLKRAERQVAFDELVASGQVVIRQMTPEEQKKWAARREAAGREPASRGPNGRRRRY